MFVQWWVVGGAVHQAPGGTAEAEDVEGDAAGAAVGFDFRRGDAGWVADQQFTWPPPGGYRFDYGTRNPCCGGQADRAGPGDALVQPVHEQQPDPQIHLLLLDLAAGQGAIP